MLGLTHRGAAELAARLVEIAPPGLRRVFYSDSGSTATEIALKMAFQYWQQRGGRHAAAHLLRLCRDAYHGDTLGSVSVGGIDLFHSAYGASPVRPTGRARRRRNLERDSTSTRGDRGGDRRAAGPGRGGDPGPPARVPAGGARALRPPRRAADLRRGRHRVRPHRDDVRLRAGARRAGLPLPRQGADRRLHAARRDARHRAGLRGLPRRPEEAAPSSTATPSRATRSPARPRSPTSTCSSARAPWCACSRRSASSASCWASRGCPRSPRSAAAASWRDRPRRARPGAAPRPPGDARGAPAGRDHPPARRRRSS